MIAAVFTGSEQGLGSVDISSRSHAPVIEPAEMCVNAIQLSSFRSATFRQAQ